MKLNNLRSTLEQMSTAELDGMLRAELQTKPVDAASVHMIMSILDDREKDTTVVLNDDIESAWAKYQAYEATGLRKVRGIPSSFIRAASIILVVGLLLFMIPLKAEADNLWERFIFLTDSVLEFFNPKDMNDHRVEYVFKTDNPGLQEVYDAVVEMGVTDPIVPMWLPEGYELLECKSMLTASNNSVHARFSNTKTNISFVVTIYQTNPTREYHKDDSIMKIYERGGVSHAIMRNNGYWSVVWVKEKIECLLTIDCQEDDIYKILQSIYTSEETR